MKPKGFTLYRQKKSYSEKSIKVQDSHVRRFKQWCEKECIDINKITYTQVLKFIDTEKIRGLQVQSITRQINSVRVYYDYLVKQGKVKHNVISRIRIRQSKQRILTGMLSSEQLEKIYDDYKNLQEYSKGSKTSKKLHQRNLIILGLLIYQGITSGEISRIERSHINLAEGKIYIAASRKSNSRYLKLQAAQVIALQGYLNASSNTQHPAEYLFLCKKHSDMVSLVIKHVKRIHPEIIDARQIRSSVIMNWLKKDNVRQVQYMAGHKSIKSTEQYRSQDLRNLTKQLDLFHPFN